jgi:CMP-N-acetylneuraminic acid synthetase
MAGLDSGTHTIYKNCVNHDLFGGMGCINCNKKSSDCWIGDCIAIIPARGGSERVPNKNILEIGGKPAISYAISTAIKSNIFSNVYVSTDSKEIASISKEFGANVIERPENISGPLTPITVVVQHAIRHLEFTGTVALIYPITPLMQTFHLFEGYSKFLKNRDFIDYVISITEIDNRCLRAFTQSVGISMISKIDYITTRSQDLPKVYRDAAMFTLGHSSKWLSETNVLKNEKTSTYAVDEKYVVDVDTLDDVRSLKQKYAQLSQEGLI